MSASVSSIRVSVQWLEQTVFAGEDIECTITFKNIAAVPSTSRATSPSPRLNGLAPASERQRKISPSQTAAASARGKASQIAGSNPPHGRGHRSTLSLNVPPSALARNGTGSPSVSHGRTTSHGGPHKRSVSIISIGASESAADETRSQPGLPGALRRPTRGHARAASLQIVPRRMGGSGGGPTSGEIYDIRFKVGNLTVNSAHGPPIYHPTLPPVSDGLSISGDATFYKLFFPTGAAQ